MVPPPARPVFPSFKGSLLGKSAWDCWSELHWRVSLVIGSVAEIWPSWADKDGDVVIVVFATEGGEGADLVSVAEGTGGVGVSFIAKDGNGTTVSVGFLYLKAG